MDGDSGRTATSGSNGLGGGADGVALCASCDRCRARKTKCDGKRPCSNCVSKFLKKNKLSSADGIDPENFECAYSPAKRRGPIRGKALAEKLKNSEAATGLLFPNQPQSVVPQAAPVWQQQQEATLAMLSAENNFAAQGEGSNSDLDQQLKLLQLQIQQQQQLLQQQQQQQPINTHVPPSSETERPATRPKMLPESQPQPANTIPRTVLSHMHLIARDNTEGSRLRSYYILSIDELFRLPATPSDEEYCAVLGPDVTKTMIPGSHMAGLSAVRFAEIALGAIVHNEVSLAMELCNAVVHCLRESVQEPVQLSIMYEVAKAYFLLGVFRAFRGDMDRYLKYRRVSMSYLAKLEGEHRTHLLLSAVSYLDAWAYMVHNANENELPDVDSVVPLLKQQEQQTTNPTETKYNIWTSVGCIASDPKNKNWIQGAPAIYLNNEAPLNARVLDALACAVRTCIDQANQRFASMSQGAGADSLFCSATSCVTPTTTAVLAHENELCSRNMVLSAFALVQQHEAHNTGQSRSSGQHLVISALDAFLENGDENAEGGFSDNQIQSLLSVCNTAVENPYLLYHAGPTYHMVSNASILLCHLLNGMHAMKASNQFGPMEATLFEEVLDTFLAVRKLLTMHRRKLPVKLRCHGLPRPTLYSGGDSSRSNSANGTAENRPFIDLGETLMCSCRGCQGFVLMACSPCVAAERAQSAASRQKVAVAQEMEALEHGELGITTDLDTSEFDMDDDMLLTMISAMIAT